MFSTSWLWHQLWSRKRSHKHRRLCRANTEG